MRSGHLGLAAALGLVALGRATAPVGEVIKPNPVAVERLERLVINEPEVESRQQRRARERREKKKLRKQR